MESVVTDTVFHSSAFASSATSRIRRFVGRLERIFDDATMAISTHHTLDELPDGVLRDIGLVRSEIPFVACTLASQLRGRRGP
ncbi:MAG: DUF1127 domain-containing protein [Xanthobacteraceae bacterium]|nr:DUF1127 domain-containing protein [Xanthobacteraceae bacterium]